MDNDYGNKIEYYLITIMYLFALITITAQIFQYTRLISLMIAVIYGLSFFLLFVTWFQSFDGLDILAIIILLLSFISVFVDALMVGKGLSFSYLRKWIMFSSTIVFLTAVRKVEPNQSFIKLVFAGNDFLAVLFIEEFFRQGKRVYILNKIVTKYLCFHFTNPNLTAMFLVSICIMELIEAAESDHTLGKIGHIFLSAFLAYFINGTKSRNGILIILLFATIYIFTTLFKRKQFKSHKGIAFFIAIYPLIFAYIYLQIINWITSEKLFSFMVEAGKSLNSRTRVWEGAVKLFRNSPIFGAYYEMSGGTGISQAHNTCLDVLTSYGVIVFALTVVFLTYILYWNGKKLAEKKFLYLAAFGCLLLMGTGEAALFSGGLCIQVVVGIFLALINVKESDAT